MEQKENFGYFGDETMEQKKDFGYYFEVYFGIDVDELNATIDRAALYKNGRMEWSTKLLRQGIETLVIEGASLRALSKFIGAVAVKKFKNEVGLSHLPNSLEALILDFLARIKGEFKRSGTKEMWYEFLTFYTSHVVDANKIIDIAIRNYFLADLASEDAARTIYDAEMLEH